MNLNRMEKSQPVIRNTRKPGVVGKINLCTFAKNSNGLISWSFEIPFSAYCHRQAQAANCAQ
jgi:hypothetical protein